MFNVKSTRDWVTEANKKASLIRSFLSKAIMNDTGLSRETVIKECMGLVNEGLLEVIYEVDCPYCFNPLTHGDKPEAKTVDYCMYCGQEDIEVEEENYFHRFILKATAVDEPVKHPIDESRDIHDVTTQPDACFKRTPVFHKRW